MNSKQLEIQIHSLTAALIEAGVCVSQNYPSVKDFGSRKEVTFTGDDLVAIALKNIPYIDLYRELDDAKCYNMKLIDGALIQMMYALRDNELLSHRLCFFPSPDLEDYKNAEEEYIEDQLYGDVVRDTIMPFPIRFDYSPESDAHKEIYHSKAHLTLGEFNYCRIPISGPMSPSGFISFLMRHFYFEDRNSVVNDQVYGMPSSIFPECISANEKAVSYFAVR